MTDHRSLHCQLHHPRQATHIQSDEFLIIEHAYMVVVTAVVAKAVIHFSTLEGIYIYSHKTAHQTIIALHPISRDE